MPSLSCLVQLVFVSRSSTLTVMKPTPLLNVLLPPSQLSMPLSYVLLLLPPQPGTIATFNAVCQGAKWVLSSYTTRQARNEVPSLQLGDKRLAWQETTKLGLRDSGQSKSKQHDVETKFQNQEASWEGMHVSESAIGNLKRFKRDA